MKITAEPRSDQWNAEDFIGGPRDFTIDHVDHGTAEQKYDIHLAGQDRVWRPPLTVLRLLMRAWGDDGAAWAGRRVRLFHDPTITFGRDRVGGIRVSHLSHIDGPVTAMLTEKRGSRKSHTVQPLTTADVVASLRAEWQSADADRRKAIEAEVNRLQNPQTSGADDAPDEAEAPAEQPDFSAPAASEDEPIDGELVQS